MISAGTERMLVDFGKSSMLGKARQQPDKVKMVIDKVRTDGLLPTLDAVRSKLDQPIPLGYCNVGRVEVVGNDVSGFAVGDRVISNGPHAEFVCVPKNLCAKIPENVTDEAASFTVIASIGLQGVRLAEPTIGECFVVIGLGLIGLLTVQILKAQGCRVLGIDHNQQRAKLAEAFGAESLALAEGVDAVALAQKFSRGRGVDGVLITAATDSNEPVSQAAKMCRKRGRIVLVGVSGLSLSRADFYEKELKFQVSCSYGPGRYDNEYEQLGHDYPVGFVRWTEQRNFEAILDLLASGALSIDRLISHRFELSEALEAYQLLSSGDPSLGILLKFNESPALDRTLDLDDVDTERKSSTTKTLSVIGAGNYAGRVLLPAFKRSGAQLDVLASNGGVAGVSQARRLGFSRVTTDIDEVFKGPEPLVIASRHDSHADFVIRALESGKSVFVEKPLCLTLQELSDIESAYRDSAAQLMVGFNRRFSPLVKKMKLLLDQSQGTNTFVATVNAGAIPADHWTQDRAIGGGRLIGECCHFVDLLRFLAGHRIASHQVAVTAEPRDPQQCPDTASVSLQFENGSVGTIHYIATGHAGYPKERIEVFGGGKVLQLDNFRKLNVWGFPGGRGEKLWRQDKGQAGCVSEFLSGLESGRMPIPADEIFEVSRVSIEMALSAAQASEQ